MTFYEIINNRQKKIYFITYNFRIFYKKINFDVSNIENLVNIVIEHL